tara:strand:+ start:45 stop:278 length:234 start_codon:yes stop_codon:yes gene_type:complete
MKLNKKFLENKLKKIFKKIFKENKKLYDMENTKNWDSLNHLRLIVEIQKEFQMKIPNIDVPKLVSQKKIVKYISKKN